ncbi:DUF1214 domain-containing protein [Desulfopila sp. IMCC35008]|uniref:DUF1214 domain-containing protein n=1 Tax=Desulfopila sp. IMCC35008 TaxID=2653858 RepID=UPI00197A9CC1|nr:DUF1214 domain-containing protein [Desulfopila sp. IMCC35008]
MKKMIPNVIAYSSISVCLAILSISSASAAGDRVEPVMVNASNFVRAETAAQFDRIVKMAGGVNLFFHLRGPTPLDKQTVIRMNRDTIYSAAVVDISKGATLTVPDTGDRYMSIMVVNEDHYINRVIHEPGEHNLTVEEFGTPFVNLSVRTLVDASDPDDIREANALQDQLKIKAASAKPYSHPDYDKESYKITYEALLILGRGMTDTHATFGSKEDVDPIRHLLGTAWGWGGLPQEEAFYLNVEPNLPVGAYQLTFRDVPVDAFWSVSLYNKDGYFDPNDEDAYSVNSLTGTPNEDGSFTIHFGGDPGSVNHLPIADGWNYTVRLYQPQKEILDGSWTFPEVKPMESK